MRVFTATLGTETNSFSAIPTGMAAFEEAMLWRPGEHPDFATEATGPLWACRRRARDSGWDVVEGTCAFAMPAGPVAERVYTELRDEIIDQLRAAAPVDAALFGLHGAMMAHGFDDCEGDLLSLAREVLGPSAIIGAELDPHAHFTPLMARSADILLFFKEYPHTDFIEVGEQLADLAESLHRRQVQPVVSVFDCAMIAPMPTVADPMRSLIDETKELERREDVLSISVVHGFSSGDHPEMGAKVLVITDGAKDEGDRIATMLGEKLIGHRERLPWVEVGIDQPIERAMSSDLRPIILVDSSDNPGGGAPGDNTDVLAALMARGQDDICCGPLWDPLAVRLCFEAGEGAFVSLRIGGKASESSGVPLDVHATVRALRRDLTQRVSGVETPLGDAACVTFDGIDVVLTTLRDQTYDPEIFRTMGVEPTERKFIIVKSSQQYRIGFEGIGADVIKLVSRATIETYPYSNISRPLWPLDPVADGKLRPEYHGPSGRE